MNEYGRAQRVVSHVILLLIVAVDDANSGPRFERIRDRATDESRRIDGAQAPETEVRAGRELVGGLGCNAVDGTLLEFPSTMERALWELLNQCTFRRLTCRPVPQVL